MDPRIALFLEIAFFAISLFIMMYFLAVKGPIARKIAEWRKEAVAARKEKLNLEKENMEEKNKKDRKDSA